MVTETAKEEALLKRSNGRLLTGIGIWRRVC